MKVTGSRLARNSASPRVHRHDLLEPAVLLLELAQSSQLALEDAKKAIEQIRLSA
jgi:hypothetical protein